MRNNIKIIFVRGLTLFAVIIFCNVLYHTMIWQGPENEEIISDIVPQSALAEDGSGGYPLRLQVPKIGVDAKVKYVGVTASGNMATPGNLTDVGWYKYGALPGNRGSAVMAGHVNNGLDIPGVFKKLDELVAGDMIYVENTKGENIAFKVVTKETFDFNAKVSRVFTQNDGAYLKLITCTGVWQPKYRTHDKRLVVTAVRVNP